jgi:CRP-like cAMP-binding protein
MMTKIMYEEIFDSPLFKGIAYDELSSLISCLNPVVRIYKRYSYITIAGEEFDSIGLLLQGEATVNKENASGNRVIMTRLKPGDMFGEALVFTDQALWPSTIQAQVDCKVMFLARNSITGVCERLCPWHRTLINNMLRTVSEKAVLLNRKVEYLTTPGVRAKLSKFLLEQYRKHGSTTFMLPMNRKELAEYLNIARPSLSREMCRMRDEGIIDFHMTSIKILDLNKLSRFIA